MSKLFLSMLIGALVMVGLERGTRDEMKDSLKSAMSSLASVAGVAHK